VAPATLEPRVHSRFLALPSVSLIGMSTCCILLQLQEQGLFLWQLSRITTKTPLGVPWIGTADVAWFSSPPTPRAWFRVRPTTSPRATAPAIQRDCNES
jgi:hypothetical protein